MNTAYLAGPMRGRPDNNYPAFHAAAKILREAGWTILSPAETSEKHPKWGFPQYMSLDIKMVLKADTIILLPGWEQSQGALAELHVAEVTGKKRLRYPKMTEVRRRFT